MKRYLEIFVLRGTESAASVLLLLMMTQIVADVLVRWFFGGGLSGTMTYVSNYYMVGVSFLPLALVNMRGEHITVDVLQGFLRGGVKRACRFVVTTVSAITVAIMTVAAFSEAYDRFSAGTTIIQGADRIIVWPSFFLYSFGFLFFLLSILILAFSKQKS